MSQTWGEIAASEIAAGRPFLQELAQKMADRDDCTADQTVAMKVSADTVAHDAGWVEVAKVYVPVWAHYLVVSMEAGFTEPSPGDADIPLQKLRLDDGVTPAESTAQQVAAYPVLVTFNPITVPSAMRGQLVDLDMSGSDVGGTGTNFKSENDPARTISGFGLRWH